MIMFYYTSYIRCHSSKWKTAVFIVTLL